MIPVSQEFARSVLAGVRALRSYADQIVVDLSKDESIKSGGSVEHTCLSAAESARQHADVLEGWVYRHARDLGLQSELPSKGGENG